MLIDNVGIVWHRLWSIRLLILTTLYTSAAGAWMVLPDDWKPELTHVEKIILAGIGMLLPSISALSVLVKQKALPAKVEKVKSKREIL